MAIGDFFEQYVQVSSQGRQSRVGYAWRQTTGADANNVCELLNDAWDNSIRLEYQALLSDEVTLQCVYARKVAPTISIPDTLRFNGETGAIAFPAFPNDSPFVVKVVTDAPSSKANGRQYITGVPRDQVTNGKLLAAYVSGVLASYIVNILADMTSVIDPTYTFEPGVICRIVDGVPQVPPVFNNSVSAVSDTFIKSQQRRRTRRTEIM